MRPIKVYIKNAKGSDLKLLNVINRVEAFAYSFGIKIEVIEKPTQKKPYALDFDLTDLDPKDIRSYSSICCQISSILHYSEILWDLTLRNARPEDGLSEIQKAKKRVQIQKSESTDYFKQILQHYDQVWYLREILEKTEYDADEKINWNLNGQELAALKRLIPKIKDKVVISDMEWNEQNAISSFDAFLTASVKYPYTKEFKKHFSLTNIEYSFLKIYRYVRTKIQPTGNSTKFDNLDSRFDRFFTEHPAG